MKLQFKYNFFFSLAMFTLWVARFLLIFAIAYSTISVVHAIVLMVMGVSAPFFITFMIAGVLTFAAGYTIANGIDIKCDPDERSITVQIIGW